ncbi:MAG TPA: BatA domain-containing protein [Longimicrobiaceae bacterium]|nr:BatA domain-containing protein [Longimicrobiaceae bacterium]
MITLGSPAFLLAGALAALVPLALHLIRRRPPARAPLPTARFLSQDPRTSVRLSRPTDLLLLALRMLLLVLAGAAFARPRWLPAPEGTSEVVLLDRGAAMAGEPWARAVDEARRLLLPADGPARGELVLFDTSAVRIPRRQVTAARLDSLAAARPAAAATRYSAGLRAAIPAARELRGADSVRVTLLTAPRWSGWSDGLAPLRRAAWPGAISIPPLGPVRAPADADSSPPSVQRAVVTASAGGGRFVTPALAATGWQVAATASEDASLIVLLAPPADPAALRQRAEAGATVLISAPALTPDLRTLAPWSGSLAADGAPGTMWLDGGPGLPGAAGRVAGEPSIGARTIAAWDDGRAAAAAARVGRGCAVFVAADLEAGELPLSAAYPGALDRLARGCDLPATPADAPLDAGALAVLRGDGPVAVAASSLAGAAGGTALGRWILGAALAVALVETFLAYRRRPL